MLLGIATPQEIACVLGVVEYGVLRDIATWRFLQEGITELPLVGTGGKAHGKETKCQSQS